MYYNNYFNNNNNTTILIIIIACTLIVGLSFLLFAFGYWLITLIAAQIFNFIIPFEWTYALGAYAILIIIRLFMLPSGQSK